MPQGTWRTVVRPFGVNAQLPRRLTAEFPYPAESDVDPALLEEAWRRLLEDGIHWSRVGQWGDRTAWDNVERSRGELRLDPDVLRALERARSVGHEVHVQLCYGNALYCGPGPRPSRPVPNTWSGPNSIFYGPVTQEAQDAFVRYCRFMARQLREYVTHFEIWNEENIGGENGRYFWAPQPRPDSYSRLLARAAQAVREEAGEGVSVIFGGLAGVDLEFLERCLDLGAGEHVDAIAFHPYRPVSASGRTGRPEGAGADIYPFPDYESEILALRSLVDRYCGGRVELLCNELGWAVPPRAPRRGWDLPSLFRHPVSEEVQAKYLLRAYLLNLRLGIRTAWWWLLNTERMGDYGAPWVADEGLLRWDGSPRPAYEALQRLCTLLGREVRVQADPDWIARDDRPASTYALGLEVGGQRVLVAWRALSSHRGEAEEACWQLELDTAAEEFEAVDLLTGRSEAIRAQPLPGGGKRLAWTIGDSPRLLRSREAHLR